MRIFYYLPLYFFISIATLMVIKFFNPSHATSSLVGTPIKKFSLPSSVFPASNFTSTKLKNQLSIINFFASWCNYCRMEHDFLLSLKKKSIPIYGIAVRDNPAHLKKFLTSHNNPYKDIGNDQLGQVAMEFGIKGFPETIVINQEGIIIYHTKGALTKKLYEKDIEPLIKNN